MPPPKKSPTNSQKTTQTTINPFDRGGNQEGTTRTSTINLDTPRPASQTTQVGNTCPNQTSAQQVSLVSLIAPTPARSTSLLDTHVQTIKTLAAEEVTSDMQT